MSHTYPTEMYVAYLRNLHNECERAVRLRGPMHPHQYADLVRGELHRSMVRMNQISEPLKRAGATQSRPYEPAN